MLDPIISERLELIIDHIVVIKERMIKITTAADFNTEDGQVIYDSILIRLQTVSENVKKIEKIRKGFTEDFLHIDATKIIRFRDIISHHYELMDPEVIFNICTHNIPELEAAIKRFHS